MVAMAQWDSVRFRVPTAGSMAGHPEASAMDPAMTQVRVEADDRQVQAMLGRAVRRLRNMQPLYDDIGAYVGDGTPRDAWVIAGGRLAVKFIFC